MQRSVLATLGLASFSLVSTLHAQCPGPGCAGGLTMPQPPAWRGVSCSQFSGWLFLCNPTGVNLPDEPGSNSPHATLEQTDPTAIITGSCNIYSFTSPLRFVVRDSVPGDLLEVVLQTRTLATPMDPQSYRLEYRDVGGTLQTIYPTSITPLGPPEEGKFVWDLTNVVDDVRDFEIRFEALGSSSSLNHVQLDARFDFGSLCADRHEISTATGGTQNLELDAGTANAGKLYLMLGSATGMTPPLSFGNGVELDLAFDAYMQVTIEAANSPLFVNSLGNLDGMGRTTVSLVLPPNVSPPFTFFHGIIAFDPNGTVPFASNVETLVITR